MKKTLGVLLFSIIFLSIVSAEKIDITESDEVVTITQNVDSFNIEQLSLIGLLFCNDGLVQENLTPSLHIITRPGKIIDICSLFYSKSDKNGEVHIGFSEGYKKDNGVLACHNDMSDNTFKKIIRNNDDDLVFELPAVGQQIKNIRMQIPKTASGEMYGCITYYLPDSYTKEEGQVFGTFVRKVSLVSINITGSVYNYGRRDDIKYVYTDNKQTVLKILIAIIALWLIMTIVNTTKKKPQPKKKK